MPLGDLPPQFTRERAGYYAEGVAIHGMSIRQGMATVFVEGVITYYDGAGEPYKTTFRYGATGDDFEKRRFTPRPYGNDAD